MRASLLHSSLHSQANRRKIPAPRYRLGQRVWLSALPLRVVCTAVRGSLRGGSDDKPGISVTTASAFHEDPPHISRLSRQACERVKTVATSRQPPSGPGRGWSSCVHYSGDPGRPQEGPGVSVLGGLGGIRPGGAIVGSTSSHPGSGPPTNLLLGQPLLPAAG